MDEIETSLDEGILIIRLNRPPANALVGETIHALADLLESVKSDVRVVVFMGEGRFFCSGLDLKALSTLSCEDERNLVIGLNRLFYNTYRLPIPTVAAVNGHCIAGGLVLALCCDYRVAASGDYLVGLTEVKAGVPYPVAAIEVCRHELSQNRFRKMVLFGENLAVNHANNADLFDEFVSPAHLLPTARTAALRTAALPANTYARVKQQVREPALAKMRDAIENSGDPCYRHWLSDETKHATERLLKG